MSLTNIAISNAKPREKPYKLTNGDGLYLQIEPQGSKLWQLAYKTLALGIYPTVSLAEAREGFN